MEFLRKLLEKIAKYLKRDEVNVNVTVPLRRKVAKKCIIDTEWLNKYKVNKEYVIIHHSTTSDCLTKDWNAIDTYHTSFRIDYNIIVAPEKDPEALIEDHYNMLNKNIYESKKYMRLTNGRWYNREKMQKFYRDASAILGEELQVGHYISKYIHKHMVETPWMNIGYNLGIERVNGELVLCYGRTLDRDGAHCYQENMNKRSIGLLIVGNYDKAAPDSEIWRFAIKVCRELMEKYPKIKFKGHREIKGVKKSCPGELFNMDQFRQDLKRKNI